MQKIIFKLTMAVTSVVASHGALPKIEFPRLLKPEIRVEKVKTPDSPQDQKICINHKTALS